MSFPYEECRATLLCDLVEAVSVNRVRISEMVDCIGVSPRNSSLVDGISFDILPWHRFVCISFRSREDQSGNMFRYSPADWKYYEFVGDNAFEATRDYTGRLYDTPPQGMTKHQCSHLIYMAAAEALLDYTVAEHLRTCGINAPIVTDQVPASSFEFMVLDEDRVLTANYCEIVIANRLTNSLLQEN